MSKHEIGDSFVITIDKIFEKDGETLYRCSGMKTLVFDKKGLEKLDSFDELVDTVKALYKTAGHSEAWHVAQKICGETAKGNLSPNEVNKIFGCCSVNAIGRYTYAEAAERIAEYEKSKPETVVIGDVVEMLN